LITIRELTEHKLDVNEELQWNGAVSGGVLEDTALDPMLASAFLEHIERNANLSRDNTYKWLHK